MSDDSYYNQPRKVNNHYQMMDYTSNESHDGKFLIYLIKSRNYRTNAIFWIFFNFLIMF